MTLTIITKILKFMNLHINSVSLLSTTKTRTQGAEHLILMATSFSPTTPLRSIFQNLPIVPKSLLSADSSFTIKRSSTYVTLKLSGSNRHSLSKGLLTFHRRYQNHHSRSACFQFWTTSLVFIVICFIKNTQKGICESCYYWGNWSWKSIYWKWCCKYLFQ